MFNYFGTLTQQLDYNQEVMQDLPTSVFSVNLVTNKYEIDNDDMRIINKKLERSMKFGQDWNGPNTLPPSIESVYVIQELLNVYNHFLKMLSINPASVQLYPLNEGGFGVELITNKLVTIFKIANETTNQDNYEQTIHYFITDDSTFEESGETQIPRLISIFLKLHPLS